MSGSKTTLGTTPQKVTTLAVQTSAYGICMGMAWGTARITGNLIWYGDFRAIEHTESQGGKGGGGFSSTSYTYRTAFAFGLVESRITGIPRVWSGKDKTDLPKLGLDLMTGAPGQSPWAYLTAKHPGEALNYPDLAYIGAADFDLGNSSSLPNLAFEVQTTSAGIAGTPDAAPWTIVTDLLGAGGFPPARTGSLADYTNFTGALGLFLSPALTEQKRAADHIAEILDMTHTAAVASEGVLKLIPYGDTAAVGNGYTWSPVVAPRFDLSDDDFLPVDGDLPIRITRKAQSDAKNRLRIEFKDRDKEYATSAAPASDEAHIAQYGERPAETIQFDAIKLATVASRVAYLKLQRGLYVLNTYEFRLGWRYCQLEPMDIVTLTHTLLGMVRVPVRILTVEEDAEGALTITAEDFPQGAGHAPAVPPQPPSGYSADMNVAPGNAAAPVVFEPPIGLTGQPEIWLASSGGATYGGCAVWVSLDNVTYQQVGVLSGKSRHGVTTALLPLVTDPDTTSTLAVDLTVSGGTLLGGTADDRDLFNTLCWVGGELVSYQLAGLTGANRYALTSLRRGAYGTPVASHASASKFVRCDDRVFRYGYDPAIIGKTLYIKLQAYNIYGGAYQDLSTLTPTAYVVQGAPLGTVGGLALEQPFLGTACAIRWKAYAGAGSYSVEIWSGGIKRRTVTGLGSTRYAYSHEDAKADGGPYRNLEFRVFAVAPNGSSGSPAIITASNPQVGAPTGITTAAAGASLVLSTNKPADTDYAGTRVWVSTISGFNPVATTPAYDGPDTWYSAMGLSSGTYYVRVAHYDVFGQDGMTTSGEIAVTVVGANGVRTVSSLPASPAAVAGDLAVFFDTANQAQRGIWGWDGTAWKFTRDGANLVANSVAADRLAVSSLSAISANMGSITSGSLTLDAAGFVRGGSTGYMTGAGIWMGYHSGLYKMHVGNPTGAGFTWDGSAFTIRGASGQVLLSTGSGIPWSEIASKPTSLSALNASEGAKLSGILDNAGRVLDGGTGAGPGQRQCNDPPSYYPVGKTMQFKWGDAVGLTGAGWITLETNKHYADNSGGTATQWAYGLNGITWKRAGYPADGVWATGWTQDLDRNAYTGDLNATYGANSSNLNVGIGVNMLANTEFVSGFSPVAMGWNPGGCTALTLRPDDVWRPRGSQALQSYLSGRSGNAWNIGCDVYMTGSYGDYHYGIPVVEGHRYEFSAKLASHRCDSGLWIEFFDKDNNVVAHGTPITWVTRNSGGPAYTANANGSGWTHAATFATAPAGATYACAFWRRSDSDVGAADSYAWINQPYFGEATQVQTVPSAYSPGAARGAFSTVDKLTAANVSTYIESAAIGNAQIGGDIWSNNFAYGSAGWLIRRDGYAEFRNILARGDVEASSLKADAANIVGTLHLQGESVTVPRSAYTAATLANITSEVPVQTLYIDTQGSPVIIIFTCKHTYTVTFRIVDPVGTTVYSGTSGDTLSAYKNFAISCSGAVSGTYTVYASAASSAAVAQRGLILLGAKR